MGEFLILIWSLLERYLVTPFIWGVWPLKWHVVQRGRRAVRFTFGEPGNDLYTGIHFFTCCQSMITEQCLARTRDASDVRTLTEDGIPLTADAIIVFDIRSLRDALTVVEDIDEFVDATANDVIRDTLQSYSLHELLESTEKVQRIMRSECNKALAGVGIQVEACRFRNFIIDDADLRRLYGFKAVADKIVEIAETLEDGGFSALDSVALVSGRLVMGHDFPAEE